MATEKQLRNTFQEMIEVLGLVQDGTDEPLLIPDDVTGEEITASIKQAIEYIRPDEEDMFSDSSMKIINELKREVVDNPDEADTIDDVEDKIDNAESLRELREIANTYLVFKKLRNKLPSYKKIGDLKDDMFQILNPEEPNYVDEEQAVEKEAFEKAKEEPVKVEPEKKEEPKKKPETKKPEKTPKKVEELPAEPVEEEVPAPKKPEKEKKKPEVKKKEPKSQKYTRTRAVAEVMKKNVGMSAEDIVKEADDLFVENGGTSNIRHSRVQYLIIRQVLEIFEI